MKEKYRVIFFRYLYQKLKLEEIEKKLVDNNIGFVTSESQMCDEEKTCYKYSKYFYLLNDIKVSKLNNTEKHFLELIHDDTSLNERIENFLESTYQNILFDNIIGKDKYYGPPIDTYMAKTNQIVIGFKRDEMGFAAHKLKTRKQIEDDDKIIKEIIEELEKNKQFNIKIITFNELFEKHRKENN